MYMVFKRFPALIPSLQTKRPPSSFQAHCSPTMCQQDLTLYQQDIHHLKCVLLNKYFGASLQKEFLPNNPGYTEHQLKLSSILMDAQVKHRALAVC